MICPARPPGNRCRSCFAAPRWTKESPQWRAIDKELPENHPARGVVSAVEKMMNLEPLWTSYSPGGTDALRPDLMLTMVLIEVWSGRQRPSQWFKDAQENLVLQWAGFGLRPSRSSWYNFRDRLGPFLDVWFREVLRIARESRVTPARRGSLDGSLLAANASRHRLLNGGQMRTGR
jgi:transposase